MAQKSFPFVKRAILTVGQMRWAVERKSHLSVIYWSEDWKVIRLIARNTTPNAATTKYTIVAIMVLLLN